MKTLSVLMATGLLCGSAMAQGFQLGPVNTEIPLEEHFSVGAFVEATVNGHGPYRFVVTFSGPTEITPDVVRMAGIATENLRAVSGHLALGDKRFSFQYLHIVPEDSLVAYMPVRDFGGYLGSDLFHNERMRVDLTHSKLIFEEAASGAPPGSIEIALNSTNDGGDVMGTKPSITAELDGTPVKLAIGYAGGIALLPTSNAAPEILEKSPVKWKVAMWTPDKTIDETRGVIMDVSLGGARFPPSWFVVGQSPVQNSRCCAEAFATHIEGKLGWQQLRLYDMTIDVRSGAAWLQPRDFSTSKCPVSKKYLSPSPELLHATAAAVAGADVGKMPGLGVWPYKEKTVAGSVIIGSEADAAGIHAGDEIVSINGGDVYQYYADLDAACGRWKKTTVVFRNDSGEHTAVLVALPGSLHVF